MWFSKPKKPIEKVLYREIEISYDPNYEVDFMHDFDDGPYSANVPVKVGDGSIFYKEVWDLSPLAIRLKIDKYLEALNVEQ